MARKDEAWLFLQVGNEQALVWEKNKEQLLGLVWMQAFIGPVQEA